MTDSVKEQLSACLDGELPRGELDLLLKRLERDPQLRSSIGRYALLGEVLRSDRSVTASTAFADKVLAAIEAEPALSTSEVRPAVAPVRRRTMQWLQPVAGLAVAAGVAAIAVLALQPTTSLPPEQIAANAPATTAPALQPGANSSSSYTVPTNTASSAYIPAARLTNYVVAHSEYSSPLGRRTVLSGVLSDDDEEVAVSGPEQEPESTDDAAVMPVTQH